MTNDPLGLFDEEPQSGGDPLGLFEEDKSNDFLGLQSKIDAAPGALRGAADAGLGMMSGLPSQIAGGLWGLSTLASGQGLKQAAENTKKAQESNFGFGAFKSITPEGEQATEKLSSAMESGIKGAGNLGYKVGGELGRTNAEIAAESIMNIVEPGAVIAGVRGAMRRKPTKVPEPVEAPKSRAETIIQETRNEEANRDAMDNRVAAMRERAAKAAKEAYERKQGAGTIMVDSDRMAIPENIDPGLKASFESKQNKGLLQEAHVDDFVANLRAQGVQEAQIKAQLEQLLAEQQKAERPGLTSLEGPDGQMSLFDQGDLMGQRNQFFADGNPDFRIDENGMPVRIDKTMEGQNLEAPLQRGLWGDELGAAQGQDVSLTQSIDNTPANGQWAQRRGMINRLGGRGQELPPSGELSAAAMEANGPLIPREDTSMFQPTNPMDTAPLGALPEPPMGGTPDLPPQTPPGGSGGLEGPFYHGTTKEFDQFNSPNGYYFTKDRRYASDYAGPDYGPNGRIITADLAMKNPYVVQPHERGFGETLTPARIAELKKQGYDGIIDSIEGEHIVFDPEQITQRGSERVPKRTRPWPMEPEVSSQITDKQGKPWDVKVSQQMVGQGTDRNLGVLVEVRDEQGRRAGVIDFTKNPDGTISAENTMVSPQMQGRGLAESMYRAAQEAGYDAVPGRYQTPEGQKMVEALQKKGLIGEGSITPIEKHQMNTDIVVRDTPSETLASKTVEVLPPEARPPVVDNVQTPRSPETIIARQEQRRAAEHMPTKLPEFEAVTTKEEAKQLAIDDGMKDKAPGFVGRNAGSGINWAAAMTNNPLIKFANTVFGNARRAADKFSRDHITGKEGLSPLWSKMNGEQRMDVTDALMAGDRAQTRITPEMMDKLGFNDVQRRWVDHYYKANDAMFDRWNQVLAEQGLKAVNRREGHVPGIFKGAYKALVSDAKGVQGVIAVDSKYQMAAAKKWFAENHPDYKIVEQDRKGLSDYKNQNDIFSGMNDVIAMLAENDPRFAEVQAIVSEAIKHGNNSMFAFNKHELSKKGVTGNVGNKPWLDKKANVDEWYKAMVQYFEEGALHHELQKPLSDVRELSNDPDLNMPKTMKYLDSYVKHISGQNANNPIANAANWAIDFGPSIFPVVGKHGVHFGVGPRQTLQMAGQLKNRMSQIFMGWGNWMFTAAQMAQPLQTGLPFMELAAGRLGKPGASAKSMAVGGVEFLRGVTELMTGKDFGSPAHMKEALQYAQDRGMLTFSEMERAYEGSKSKLGRAVDKVAEANMKAGEVMTRTPMFLSFVDMLHSSGIPIERALPIAENMTQLSMIDYHQWERPQMYAKLGTVGQFAGGLTTFKHGYVGQQGVLGKELGRTGNPIPIAASVAAMVALAGIAGMPFYDELDNLYGDITNKFGDKRKNIRDSFLENFPEWAKSGAISNASGIAIQSKFSSANMVPDTTAKALSPQLDAFGKIILDSIDVAMVGDDQAWANLMMDITPSTFKGLVEDKMLTDEDGLVHNRQMEGTVTRTPEERNIRKWTGLRSQREALLNESNYRARKAIQDDTDTKNEIRDKWGRSVINDNEKPREKLLEKFIARDANPTEVQGLIDKFKERAIAKNTEEEARRNMGIKGTPGDARKFEYYNKPGER